MMGEKKKKGDEKDRNRCLIERIGRRIDDLENEKKERLYQMTEIGNLIAPYRVVDEDVPSEYEEYGEDIFETRPIDAKKKMVNGLFAYTCGPNSAWFECEKDERSKISKKEIENGKKEMYKVLRKSRFYREIHKFIDDEVSFGTAAILTRKIKGEVSYKTINPFRFVFEMDDFDNVIFFAYKFFMSKAKAKATLEMMGVEMDSEIEAMIGGTPNVRSEKTEFWYVIEERKNFDIEDYQPVTKDKKKYGEYLIIKGMERPVKEGGYSTCPVTIGRFYETSGNIWGYCPADDVFRDIKYVNMMMDYYLKGSELRAVPPMMAPLVLKSNDFRYAPEEVYWTMAQGMEPKFLSPGGDMISTKDILETKMKTIEQAFLVDFWTMLSQTTKRMTTYEVSAQEGEKLAMLAEPMQAFIDSFTEILQRTKEILIDMNKVSKSLNSSEFSFIGYLITAQRRLAEGQGDIQTLQEIAALLGVGDAMDNFNVDFFIRKRGEINNASVGLIRDEAEVKKRREARARQMMAQQQKQELLEGAKVSNNGTSFETMAKLIMGR